MGLLYDVHLDRSCMRTLKLGTAVLGDQDSILLLGTLTVLYEALIFLSFALAAFLMQKT